MGELLYYNFAAGSFHTKKLCSRRLKLNVIQNIKNRFLTHLSGDLGIMYALHL